MLVLDSGFGGRKQKVKKTAGGTFHRRRAAFTAPGRVREGRVGTRGPLRRPGSAGVKGREAEGGPSYRGR